MKTEMVVVSCEKDRDIDMNGIGIQTEIVGPIRFAKYNMNPMNSMDWHMRIYRLGSLPQAPTQTQGFHDLGTNFVDNGHGRTPYVDI